MRRLLLALLMFALGATAAAAETLAEGPDWRLRVIAAPPAAAPTAGAVLWLHGYSPRTPSFSDREPALAAVLAAAGWRVTMLDRARGPDRDLAWGEARVAEAVALLRRLGAARVVLAGHSRGAWLALRTLARPELEVDGALAFSPATHGPNLEAGSERQRRALADWSALLDAARRRPIPIAIGLFDEDGFDPDPQARAVAAQARFAAGPERLRLYLQPPEAAGHDAALDPGFAAAFGACLARWLLEPPAC